MSRLKPHYSGVLSVKFWDRVNKLPSPGKETLYCAGCLLQNVEGDVLRWLETVEAEASKVRKP